MSNAVSEAGRRRSAGRKPGIPAAEGHAPRSGVSSYIKFTKCSTLRMGIFLASVVMAGCSTPEYRAAKDACTVEWTAKIPPKYVTEVVTRHRFEKVPDGTETCTTEVTSDRSDPLRYKYTHQRKCTPNMKEVEVPYEVQETIDIRAGMRNARIGDCSAQRCLASHGNVSCDS